MSWHSTLSSYWYNAIYEVMREVGYDYGYDVRMCKLRQSASGVTLYDRDTFWVPGNGADEIKSEFFESLLDDGIAATAKRFGTGWIVDVVDFNSAEVECAHEDEFDIGGWMTIIQEGEA